MIQYIWQLLTTITCCANITGHKMSQSFVSNMLMSSRAEDNKTVINKLRASALPDGQNSKQQDSRERGDLFTLPSVASYNHHDREDLMMPEMMINAGSVYTSAGDQLDVADLPEPDLYSDSINAISSDEERRAETLHVNKAAIDVSRRLDKLSILDPTNADRYARKCSNLIAMAELLASEARHKAAAILKAEKDGKWILKAKNRLPEALSQIIGSRQQSRNAAIDNSHYSSYLSNTYGSSSVERSESAPAIMQGMCDYFKPL